MVVELENFSRRSFLKSSATGAALATGPAIVRSLGANEKLNIAWIGVGTRGNYLMDMFYEKSAGLASVTSVCDAYTGYQDRAKEKVKSKEGKDLKIVPDYRELLAQPDIDAVVIATPEHLHHPMGMAAIGAKKNIYLEKALAHTIEQGAELVK